MEWKREWRQPSRTGVVYEPPGWGESKWVDGHIITYDVVAKENKEVIRHTAKRAPWWEWQRRRSELCKNIWADNKQCLADFGNMVVISERFVLGQWRRWQGWGFLWSTKIQESFLGGDFLVSLWFSWWTRQVVVSRYPESSQWIEV